MTAQAQAPDVQVYGPAVLVQGRAVNDLIYVLGLILNARREPRWRHEQFERLRADLLRAFEFPAQPAAVRRCDVVAGRGRASSTLQPGEVTVAEGQRLTGLSRRQIQRLAKHNGLGRWLGTAWAVDRAGLLTHVAAQRERRGDHDNAA